MGTRSGRSGRGGWALAVLVIPALLSTLGTIGSTAALFGDHEQASLSFAAMGPTPPTVTPETVTYALHVGDRCEMSPMAEVRTSSGWRVDLSVTASGWLDNSDVVVMPTNIGPGEVAIVFFTKAAVQGPTAITGQVVVTANPGGHQTVITLAGSVTQPADASLPDEEPHPPGCVGTPRPKGFQAEVMEPEIVLGDEGAPEEAPSEAPEEETPPPVPMEEPAAEQELPTA